MSSERIDSLIDSQLVAVGLLVVSCLVVFGDVLFLPGDAVPSGFEHDVATYFAPSRAFGISELSQGNLPLWNPHVFSGTPYLASFQAGLLYPPNVVYLMFPLAKAISVDVAAHIFLAGLFVMLWVRNRGALPMAAALAGVVFMFSGSFYLHLYSGHITLLSTYAWAPLVALAVDKLFDRPNLPWCLVGMFAATMQILGGLPQGAYLTALVVGTYCVLRILASPRLIRAVPALAAMAVGPLFLSAAQLWTAIQMAGESVRAGGLPNWFANVYSFPPENLLTLIIPDVFGDTLHFPYWGRWAVWEVSVFIGLVGTTLALMGALFGTLRLRRFDMILMVFVLVVSLGRYTPLYEIMFESLPGFDRFRIPSRTLFLFTMYTCPLIAAGAHRMIEHSRRSRDFAIGTLLVGVVLTGLSLYAWRDAQAPDRENQFQSILSILDGTNSVFWDIDEISSVGAAANAAKAFAFAAATCLMLVPALWFSDRSKLAGSLVILLGIVEMTAFSRTHRDTFNLSEMDQPGLQAYLESHDGDYRILDHESKNRVFAAGGYELWGYDPIVLRRYADFISMTQEERHSGLLLSLFPAKEYHESFRLFRGRLMYGTESDEWSLTEKGEPLSRFELVSRYEILPDLDQIFAALTRPDFDPRQVVFLQEEPEPPPIDRPTKGTISYVDGSTDHFTLRVETDNPTILLITDAYSDGWRVRSFEDSVQQEYDLIPANYVLQAIPLKAGKHHFTVEYAPSAFRVGSWVSIVSIVLFAGAAVFCLIRSARSYSSRSALIGTPQA